MAGRAVKRSIARDAMAQREEVELAKVLARCCTLVAMYNFARAEVHSHLILVELRVIIPGGFFRIVEMTCVTEGCLFN